MEEQRVSGERQEAGVALSLAGKGLPELERNEKVIELKICWKRRTRSGSAGGDDCMGSNKVKGRSRSTATGAWRQCGCEQLN